MKYVLPLTIDFERSHGSFLHDKKSHRDYLDFFSLYSSLPLGYNHPAFNQAFKEKISQIAAIKMANNVCESDEFFQFFEVFKKVVPFPFIHFTSTGALAVESAIKTAMEYKKVEKPIVLSMEKSFHGVNSWGLATSTYGVTGKRMEYFLESPWLQLDIDSLILYLETSPLDRVVAVLIEPIQCTNGDIYIDPVKLTYLKTLCVKKDICLIFDEIQTGFGTTGKMWYHEHLNIEPDIVIFGKKSQVSGISVHPRYKAIFDSPYQKLDVTFDGDLIDMIRSHQILNIYTTFHILENVQEQSQKLRTILSPITSNYRSCGHLIAFDFESTDIRDRFLEYCFKHYLLINKAGEKTVRLRPNLALSKEEVLLATSIIKDALETL